MTLITIRWRNREGVDGEKNNELRPDQPRYRKFPGSNNSSAALFVFDRWCQCKYTKFRLRPRAAQSRRCHFDSADYHELMDYFYFAIEYNFGLLRAPNGGRFVTQPAVTTDYYSFRSRLFVRFVCFANEEGQGWDRGGISMYKPNPEPRRRYIG